MLPEDHLAELAHSLSSLCSLARQQENALGHSVPACPGWTLDDLFGHLSSIERWAAAVVGAGEHVQQPVPPAEGAASWFLEGAPAFLDEMASLDPEAPCWGFGPPPRKAGFWLRRQAHEHVIHFVDARQALDLPDVVPAEDFLIDGIDEVLGMFVPRQLRLGRMTDPGQAVAFWLPDGRSWTIGSGAVAASVTAPPYDMYLGLWGRSSFADTAVIDGDVDLAVNVLRGPLTP